MQATASQQPISETYTSVEKMIFKVCHKFAAKYGGDVEEMIGEARIVYMRVYEAHDASKGKFTTILWHSIVNALKDQHAKGRRRQHLWQQSLDAEKPGSRQTYAADVEARSERTFDKAGFAAQLTEDARVVLRLVLDAPQDMQNVMKFNMDKPHGWINALRRKLRGMEWTHRQIADAFYEIRQALES